jgi:ribosomal-protein-alanine N-acetyltransferase
VIGSDTPFEMVIRPMELDDIPEVRAIDVASFTLPWPENSFRFEIKENSTSRVWVAEHHEEDGSRKIVAMIVAWLILDEAHIGTFAVHPDYRRLRIGQRLLAKTLLAAYDDGVRVCYLEVRRSNLSAIHLYEKFGFVVTSVRPRYYRDNHEDAFLMTLDPLEPARFRSFLNPSGAEPGSPV